VSYTRFVAKIVLPAPVEGAAVDGGTSAIRYMVTATPDRKSAKEFFQSMQKGKFEGGKVAWVKPENDKFNIPALEPEAWARFQLELADINRRCGRRA
jgi:hypothetical protein